MIVTIIPADSHAYVDGVARPIDMTGIDPAIHAVQWDGLAGEIEYTRADGRRNEAITDLSPYQVFIDRWTAAAPPPPPPLPPKSAAPLTAQELADQMITDGTMTQAKIDAIKTGR